MSKFLSLIAAALFSVSASATWQIEPKVGMQNGNFSTTDVASGGVLSGTSANTVFGFKLGYINEMGWFFGVAGFSGSGTIKLGGADSLGNIVSDFNTKATYTNAEIGYYFPSFFKVYAGTTLSDEMTLNNEVQGDLKLTEGSAMHIGVGLMIWSNVALEFEYRTPKYKKFSSSSVTADNIDNYLSGMSQSSISTFISFPVQF